jgi:hypothetical protein
MMDTNALSMSSQNSRGGKKKTSDIDEWLENHLKNLDRIDEESYSMIKGMFAKLLTTHNGSVLLQKNIKKTNNKILALILEEIAPFLNVLMIDPYANYFCQKFFSLLNNKDRIKYLKQVSPYLSEVCKSKVGTYPMQTIIEIMIDIDEKKVVVEAIKENVYDLCLVKHIYINILKF